MKKALLFILLFISGFSFSQNILVPYRKGQLWGLADTLGKQVCPPQYDQVLFKDEFGQSHQIDLPDNYFIVKKGNKSGVFSTKEIIPPQFERIQCVNKAFFGCSDEAGGNLKYWFALDGTSLLPEGYLAQSLVGQFDYNYSENKSRYYCYIVKATNATYGIYYFDTQTPKRSRFLIKDCHKIKYDRDEQTLEMEFIIDISINVSKKHGHLRLNKAKQEIELYYKSESDYAKQVEDLRNARYQEVDERDEMMIEAPPMEVVPNGSNSPKKEVVMPIQTYMRGNFEWKADTLRLRMVNSRIMRTGQTSMNSIIPLPKNAEKIKLVNYLGYGFFGLRKSDTLFQYSNYATFQLRTKKGLIVSDISSPFYADSILQIKTTGYNEMGCSFLFGQKDKSGKMLLGWMTAEGKEMIPALYEDIQFKSSFVSPEYNYASDKWIVTKSGKVGMIDPTGTLLLDTKYDAITLVGKSFSSPIYRLLKKDGKYGVYYLENEGVYTGKEWILMEPFTPYKISALRFIPRGKSKQENYFTLLRLEDEIGHLIGYRSRSGIDFFEN